jgi:hypothetical protein
MLSDSQPAERLAHLCVRLGAAGVVLTSLCYALSPAALALPVPWARVPEALQQAQAPILSLWLAATFGLPSDVIFAVGALGLGLTRWRGPHPLEGLGWLGLAVSNLIFIPVDGLVGRVLQPVAALAGSAAAFSAVKALFDALFTVGTLAFGLSALCVFAPSLSNAATKGGRASGLVGTGLGAIATAGSLACLLGANAGQLLGLCIAAGSLLIAVVGSRPAGASRVA